ncbi:hypothetical protein ACTWP5_18350 [Streptomyces sp. 4N509B]|uniref:hypothetical protein n=1 Tax=Streptomyces sp. 4N509B TaxID=3457413 RepID=UPI003FD00751
MTDRRRSEEDNPFAPPPEGQPDQPWRPRYPDQQRPEDASGRQEGRGDDGGSGEDGRPGQRSRWGSQWSRRQPRRQNGGFGDPPPSPSGRNGDRDRDRNRGGDRDRDRDRGGDRDGGFGARHRWDPSDPAQRHARYAVMAGLWGILAAGPLGWLEVGLLLGALAMYWGISALRGGPRQVDGGRDDARRERLVAQLEGRSPQGSDSAAPGPEAPGSQPPGSQPPGSQPPGAPAPGAQAPGWAPRGGAAGAAGAAGAGRKERPQFAAAVAGIVLAASSLAIAAGAYTLQFVYKDYYDCVADALTTPARETCEQHLPSEMRRFLTEPS